MVIRRILISFMLTSTAYGVTVSPKTPYLRLDGAIYHPKINKKSELLAYSNPDGMGLYVLDLKTRKTKVVTPHRVNGAYFWAPDNTRLIFREIFLENGKIMSAIKAFDNKLNRPVEIDSVEGPTSDLSFDPRDHRFYAMSKTGIKSHLLQYPSQRLAAWQKSQRTKIGYWLATVSNILWIHNRGVSMRSVSQDTGNNIEAHSISPNGEAIVWAHSDGKIFVSDLGGKARFVDFGTDPSWHPDGKHIVYAKSIRVAGKAVSHNIAIATRDGHLKQLSHTPNTDERFPIWLPKSSSILYTHHLSTDLFEMSFDL
ncbi:MAG: PD40 domain-containing protein [Pseudobacteriovorax sp.]|nr:PD40 domain-containing protein [Pseudobacteriovorax sp.]